MSTLLLLELPEVVHKDVAIFLVGSLAHWMLYGVLVVQVCLYYSAFPKDYRILKLIVLVQLVLETVQTVMITHDLYKAIIFGFENPLLVNEIGTTWFSVPLLTALIALLARMFYCYRTAVLTRSKCAVALIVMLSIGQVASATAVAVQTRAAGLISNLLRTKIDVITAVIWAVSDIGCDTTTAIIMVYYLKKRDTGLRGTHNIIKRVIRLTIETGLITASFTIIAMVLAYIPGHLQYFQIALFIEAKLYSNSMIAALNSRITVMSNSPHTSPPSWNESVNPVESMHTKTAQDLVFLRHESFLTLEGNV